MSYQSTPPITVRRYTDNPDPIIRALVRRRLDLGLSQADVAHRMGVQQNQVSRFERSLHPSLTTVERYAEEVDADLMVVAR